MSCNPCNDCNQTSLSYVYTDCVGGEPCDELMFAECIKYKGPNLPNIGVTSGMKLKELLININKYVGGPQFTKTYTVLVNSLQSATTIEYLDLNDGWVSITVTASTSPSVICARENSPVIISGTGSLIKGPIVYTSSIGATSSGVTITVASTTGLVVGQTVFVYSGVGKFADLTTVASIVDSTHFTVSSSPITALSGGQTIIKAYTTGSVIC